MSLRRVITPLKQKGETCGQTCIAMLSGITEEESVSIVGVKGGTHGTHLISGLKKLNIRCSERSVRFVGFLPKIGILRIKSSGGKVHQTNTKAIWRGHWVLIYENAIYDPGYGASTILKTYLDWMKKENFKFTSFVEILEGV